MKLKACLILSMFLFGVVSYGVREASLQKKEVPKKEPKPTSMTCTKRPIVVAIIDTGFGLENEYYKTNLCKFGHKDFTTNQEFSNKYGTKSPVPVDHHGHGTHIAGLIDQYAKKNGTNYCLVILKYYDPKVNLNGGVLGNSNKAIEYAINIHADFINYSGGGDYKSEEEQKLVKKFLDRGGKFIAAAGNGEPPEFKGLDLDNHTYYPAMDDPRIIVVGNLSKKGSRVPSSNYGKIVKRWEIGENVHSFGGFMTGTSQAAAIATGKIVAQIKRACN